jgi:hypothetical protein
MGIDKNIKRILGDHERRIAKLESLVAKPKAVATKKERKPLTDYITELRAKGFFSQPKTSEETHKKLRQNYHCEPNRVAVALLRLVNRKHLRKASKTVNGKKFLAYVW